MSLSKQTREDLKHDFDAYDSLVSTTRSRGSGVVAAPLLLLCLFLHSVKLLVLVCLMVMLGLLGYAFFKAEWKLIAVISTLISILIGVYLFLWLGYGL